MLELQLTKFNNKNALSRTPLNEGSVRCTGHHLHNIHNRQTSIPKEGFEPTIPESEPPQTCALDRVATEISEFLTAKIT